MKRLLNALLSFQFRIFFAMLVVALFVGAAGWLGLHQLRSTTLHQLQQQSSEALQRLATPESCHGPACHESFAAVLTPRPGTAGLLPAALASLQQQGREAGIVELDNRRWYAATRKLNGDRVAVTLLPATPRFDRPGLIAEAALTFLVPLLLLTTLLSLLLSRSIVQPLLTLRHGIDRIGTGELSHRVKIRHPDIARDLAISFNRMADSLEKSLIEVKNTYAELQEKEKLAAVGKMTAGIAHEIKNPLGIILGSTQVMLDARRPQEMRDKAASFIMDEVVRLDTTLKAFLDFARPAPPVFTELDIAENYEETLTAIEERYREEGYTIQRNFESDLPKIEADPGQMRQILMNILLNAFAAMPGGGTVTITIGAEREPEMGLGEGKRRSKRFISTRNPFTVARNWVIIRITDHGTGMSSETVQKALDPFVSFSDDGIGLGLSIVSQLVKLHRGNMRIDSSPGSGTTFTLFFPCLLNEPEINPDQTPHPEARP